MLHDKKWKIDKNKNLDLTVDVHPVVKQLLVNRGYDTDAAVEQFLNPSLQALYDPLLMFGMDKVVKRINEAIQNGESIWIYGDYDVDGITSISVLVRAFEYLKVPVNYYIPNRLEEGYGLSVEGLDKILIQGADLIISVDCGITSVDEVEYVNARGKDIIITDHHNCQEQLPDAYAILNPKQQACSYPFDMLAGVGIAMKLVQALLGDAFITEHHRFTDIAALGTVADIAPIIDENRIITKIGIQTIEATQNIGLQALIEASELKAPINTGHIGFNLGPKLNAAGRIGQPELGVQLLTTHSEDEAILLAKKLTLLNEERQNIEKEILSTIDKLIEEQVDLKHDKIIVILGENWHTGVIGIVASRVSEKYHKPSVILSAEEGIAKGSARSVGDISIFDALNSCKSLFLGFGGHKQAAGLSLDVKHVDALRKQINVYANNHITEDALIPQIKVDGILHSRDITYKTLDDLDLMEPFGLGNPRPNFVYNGLTIDNVRKIGAEKDHLKMILHDDKRTFDAIGFRIAERYADLRSQDKLDMVMTLSKNSFRGVDTIQFMIKDIRRLAPEFYVSLEIGKLFTKTLARALFYNGLGGPIGPLSSFIEYEHGNLNRLDYATQKGGKKLILVNAFVNFLELYFRLDDLGYMDGVYGIHFNEIMAHHEIDILIHPIISRIDFENYHEVIVYDLHYGKHWADQLASRCHKPIKYLSNLTEDEKIQSQVLYTAVPHRMDLVDIYKALLSEEGTLTITLEDFSRHLHMDETKCELSLRILDHLKLIRIEGDATYHITVLPKPEEKLALDQTTIYQMVSSIRDTFFDYIKYYKELIK